MDSPSVSGKRKVSLISPNRKDTRRRILRILVRTTKRLPLLTWLALSKLEKLDTIEKRLDSMIASISSIEETVGRLDKDVLTLKKKTSKT